ncbi:nuclear transport factor 2 family protein [Curtobacterium pusillum]|uniref:nuclear transport factor 2 family protein n=1 Tax=Curtobacterium pusillum TaxID=69373 RepID=UPI0037FCA65F
MADRLGEVFATDAVVSAGRGLWNGRSEILAGLQEAYTVYAASGRSPYPFHHAITNHWVEFTSDHTAEGRSYLLDLQTAETAERWILLGTYADEYVIEDGDWRIGRSQLDVTWPEPAVGGGVPGDGLVVP